MASNLDFFGAGKADGHGRMKDVLGGKGAGLAEMTNLGLPVPPGFTISIPVCEAYHAAGGKLERGVMDEIRKKYRADREFKQTVDRYVGEFERLLEEVSRGDRGQVVARTYLTSETGKVYTMLAHAAGRFGE